MSEEGQFSCSNGVFLTPTWQVNYGQTPRGGGCTVWMQTHQELLMPGQETNRNPNHKWES